jgi:hypothetical protein
MSDSVPGTLLIRLVLAPTTLLYHDELVSYYYQLAIVVFLIFALPDIASDLCLPPR